MQLHENQHKLLKFLIENEDALNDMSLWQIARETNLGSAQNVSHHLKQLEKKGYLRKGGNSSYEILKDPIEDVIRINQYGMASCGHSSEFVSESNLEDKISVSTKLFNIADPSSIFAVIASGESMSPYIKEGDLVLFQESSTLDSPGQMSLVLHNENPKIKKVIKENGKIILRSSNPEYADVEVKNSDDFEIVGVAKAVIHSLNKTD